MAFDERVNRVATGLADRGVRKGDRVAMVLFDTVEFPSVLYACYRIGAVAVPTNVMLATGNVRYVFDEMHPTVLVYGDEVDLTVHPAVAAGSTMVVTTDWDPEPAPDTIEAYGVTLVVDVPTVARRIANLEDVDERVLSIPECLMCMGSPLSRRLAETLIESVTPNVFNGYGTSETLLDALLRLQDLPEHAGTVGRPTPEMEVRVVEFDRSRTVLPDETVPPGEEEGSSSAASR